MLFSPSRCVLASRSNRFRCSSHRLLEGSSTRPSRPVRRFTSIGYIFPRTSNVLILVLDLFTVAPNVTGAAMLLILAFTSDLTRRRGPFIVLGFLFTFTGFIIYAAIDVLNHLHVAYFATFMMCWGTSAPSVLLSTCKCITSGSNPLNF